MPASMASRTAGRRARAVPPRVAVSGITFQVAPPSMRVTLTTAASRGSVSRLTNDCRATTAWAAACTGSRPWWGIAAWPPRPMRRASKRSKAAIMGPARMARWPAARPGQLCRPKTWAQSKRSNSPSSTMRRPPPSFSSAGWKMKCTVPANRGAAASDRAAPSSMAVWPSCPQACMRPGWVEAWATPERSVRARASRSARRPMAGPGRSPRKVATTPVPARPVCTVKPGTAPSRAATLAAARCSSKASSGCACISLRNRCTSSMRAASFSATCIPGACGAPSRLSDAEPP